MIKVSRTSQGDMSEQRGTAQPPQGTLVETAKVVGYMVIKMSGRLLVNQLLPEVAGIATACYDRVFRWRREFL